MSCERLVSFATFSSNVPSPPPVLAVTVHSVAGEPPVGVTVVIAGVPVSPTLVNVKLLAVRPAMAEPNVTVHWTVPVFVGDDATFAIEATVVSGRSTGVQVLVPIAGAAVQ